MKKLIVCGLAGLMSVGLIAGCGMRQTRDGCCTGQTRNGLAQRNGNGWWARNRAPVVGTESVVVVSESTKPVPTESSPAKAAPKLPDIPPIPTIEAPAREKKIDYIEEENAIINREIAGMGSSGVQVVPQPTNRSEVRLIDQSVNALPTVTVEPPATPAPLPKGPGVAAAQQVTPVPIVEAPTQERIIADNGKEKTVALKSVDIHYGQTDNYTTITGQLQEYRRTMRLRYAAMDQEDP